MTVVVNLRAARKRRDRALKEQAAEENRIRHGRPKAERTADEAVRERSALLHEAHRREKPDGEGPA